LKPNNNKIDVKDEAGFRKKLAIFTVVGILLIDQISKIWVKTNMYLDESIPVFGDWFFIHFIENPGMAFGVEFGGEMGKLLLSLFRIVAIGFITYYITNLIKQKAAKGLIFSVALVLAGATGNIIDSAFYGLIFSESPPHLREVANIFPPDGGYASFLHGKVVDMLYFPLIDTRWPDWIPFFGGDRLQFFRTVFNIADSSITIGMALILINQKKYFDHSKEEREKDKESADEFQSDKDSE
jgi:signal peptidase II